MKISRRETEITAAVIILIFAFQFIRLDRKIPGTPKTALAKVKVLHETERGYIAILEIDNENKDFMPPKILREVRLNGNFTLEEDKVYAIVYKTTWRPYHWNLQRVKKSRWNW